MAKPIALAADHGGFELKEAVRAHLDQALVAGVHQGFGDGLHPVALVVGAMTVHPRHTVAGPADKGILQAAGPAVIQFTWESGEAAYEALPAVCKAQLAVDQAGNTAVHITNLKVLPIYILCQELPSGRYHCRLVPFSRVLEDNHKGAPFQYGLTAEERADLPRLENTVWKRILLPRKPGNILWNESS